jgi:hypothetical protein
MSLFIQVKFPLLHIEVRQILTKEITDIRHSAANRSRIARQSAATRILLAIAGNDAKLVE